MQFEEMGNMSGKTLMLLPGTCCDYQTNFGTVIPKLSEKYHLICVNYDRIKSAYHASKNIYDNVLTQGEPIKQTLYKREIRAY